MNREQETLKALSQLQFAFGKEFDKEHLIFYVTKLSDVEPVILAKAVDKIIQTKDFLPSIAELRRTATEIEQEVNGTKDKDVDQAWAEVCQAVKKYFVYRTPEFTSSAIRDAVKAMGWMSLCTREERDEGTYRAQFRDFYLTAVARHKNDNINKRLGVFELKEEKKRIASDLQPIGKYLPNGDLQDISIPHE